MQREFPVIKREHAQFLCMNQGGNAGKARSLFWDAGFLYFLEGGRLTMAKEQVQAITKMEEDFAQWYTDIVKKAELVDYSSVKGCMILRPYGYALWENMQKLWMRS